MKDESKVLEDEPKVLVLYSNLVSDIAFLKNHIWRMLYLISALYGFIYYLRSNKITGPIYLFVISAIYLAGFFILDKSFEKLEAARQCKNDFYKLIIDSIKPYMKNSLKRYEDVKDVNVVLIQKYYFHLSSLFIFALICWKLFE